MKRLTEMKFFEMVTEKSPPKVTLDEVELAFNEFANYVTIISDAESEHSKLYRTLAYTRTRLQTLQGRTTPNKAEKMCPSLSILMMQLGSLMQN